MQEVVGLFGRRSEAERAIDDLYALGFGDTEIGFLDRDRDENLDGDTTGEEAAKGATGGAVGGAAVGAGAGLLATAGVLLVPGIGPFLAAGTLAATLASTAAGAAGGAAIGGALGAIFGASDGDDDDTGVDYRQAVDRGGVLVTVATYEGRELEAVDAFRNAGAERVNVYSNQGWIA